MKKIVAILCVLLLFAITACAPQAPMEEAEDMPMEEPEMPAMEPEAMEEPEMPMETMPAAEPEEEPEDMEMIEPEEPAEEKTDIEKFKETSEYLQGTPGDVRAGSYEAPEFLKTIAFKDKLGNRLTWWGIGFEINQIEKYAVTIVTFPNGEAKAWDLDVYDDVIFDNSPQCQGEANCGDIPFAYTWDLRGRTILYCPLSIPICKQAKQKYVNPYN
ncbi:hypothetical protein KY326_02350 [Candidatus Woesearchaeota archaeon]|nr:hypothetical protein [Candidatus Woesearchaeota archaeon]